MMLEIYLMCASTQSRVLLFFDSVHSYYARRQRLAGRTQPTVEVGIEEEAANEEFPTSLSVVPSLQIALCTKMVIQELLKTFN